MTDGTEEDANKRARVDVKLNPHDDSLRNHPMITSLNVVALKTLEKENQFPSNRNYIDAMLLRIIPPSGNMQDNKFGSLRMYGPKKTSLPMHTTPVSSSARSSPMKRISVSSI